MWDIYKKGFKAYLQLEKSLSENSVEAYLHDIDKLTRFLSFSDPDITPSEIKLHHLEKFLRWISELGMTPSSQSRIISGLRNFYKYCIQEHISKTDPTALLETPKLIKHLPDVLSFTEIESIINGIDVSTGEGARNKAIIETLYSSGLR